MTQASQLAVIITCYNYERFVGRAIRSVLDQAHPLCELVVVDDGSSDQSWAVIRSTGVTSFRIENAGQLRACREALARTRASFVLFLDADDELKPGSLDRIIRFLDPAVAKLQFSLTRIDGFGRELDCGPAIFRTFRGRDGPTRQVLRGGSYPTPPTSGNVFRRDLCELLRGVDYEAAVDGVMLFAAPFFGDVVSTSEELGCYRIHGGNDSGLQCPPEPALIERELSRFLARMQHLRDIIQDSAVGEKLVDPTHTFFFRERSFYLALATGRRPQVRALPGLLNSLLAQPHSLKHKAGLAAFFLLASMLSGDRAKALLAYRAQSLHRRTALGFARVVLAGHASD